MRRRRRLAAAIALAGAGAGLGVGIVTPGCFGTVNDPVRHYYTLHLQPLRSVDVPRIAGLLRVRDLDPESAYDRFQIVSRRSPFELSYRQREVWAVKPNRMLSDIIARAVSEQAIFSGVSREIGERRPDYLLSGELQAIEVYDSDTQWYAHLAMSLQISHFETGTVLWTYHADTRKPIPPRDFAHAVRALSELASEAVAEAIGTMRTMRAPEIDEGGGTGTGTAAGTGHGGPVPLPPPSAHFGPSASDDELPGDEGARPITVPELPP